MEKTVASQQPTHLSRDFKPNQGDEHRETQGTAGALIHAMTVDVEDYFHVAAFGHVIKTDEWDQWPCRVEANTDKLLQLFDEVGIKATFFILGWVAERYPQVIRAITTRGHEIASHGYSHQLIYKQTPAVFREETARSKALLEDRTGQAITGYRAASYSITRQSLWALDILSELGFTWDSSIFPVIHDNYGIPGSPRHPYQIELPNGGSMTEFPLTTAKLLGYSLPAAGGGYFRQYPYPLSKWLFKRASEQTSNPQIFYLHPWEVDPDQPRIPGAGWKSRFRHYTNLGRCYRRLEQLLRDFQFGTVRDSLGSVQITKKVNFSKAG